MSSITEIHSYIPLDYQNIIIKGFNQFSKEVEVVSQNYHSASISKPNILYITQWIFIAMIQYLFGLNFGVAYKIITSDRAPLIKEFLINQFKQISCRSWADKHIFHIIKENKNEFKSICEAFQDYFYENVGGNARKKFTKIFQQNKQKINAPFEIFISLFKPSEVFKDLDVLKRGELMPYLNTIIFQHLQQITSKSELVGRIKTPEYEDNEFSFKLAGKLGFVNTPPGKHKFGTNLPIIEQNLENLQDLLNQKLVEEEVIDLTVVSVDGCNIPIDKRDTTATQGTGSKGAFFGHKCSIGIDTNCIPINSETKSGNTADISLYNETIKPIIDLAKKTDKDIWVQTADAAYTSTYLIDDIIANESVPIIDINPRSSKLLKELKVAAANLQILSKKAIKNGLSKDERKAWTKEAKEISKKNGHPLSYNQKKKILPKLLKKWAEKARNRGLTKNERRTERGLRKKVQRIRQKIRKIGTFPDKKIGLGPIMQGTIEWFLIYHIRGQNEGFNGILKKRGFLIGDGQHTTWDIGQQKIHTRIKCIIVMYKVTALVCSMVTGGKRNVLKRVYNWLFSLNFYVIFLDKFLSETPRFITLVKHAKKTN